MSDHLLDLDRMRVTTGARLAGVRPVSTDRLQAYLCGGALDAEVVGHPCGSESAAVDSLARVLGQHEPAADGEPVVDNETDGAGE